MEVYFADVGQGTSNVILIGKRRALVIDTGRRASDLRLLLHHLNIDTLTCLVLSHLDDDHAGGAPALLTEFRGQIGRVWYPNDHRIRQTPCWEKLHAELDEGHLERQQLVRLECEQKPKTIWRSTSLKAELKLFSPTFGENQEAMESEDTNATSGVLVLKVGNRRIVFPGDSRLEQWQEIRRRRGSAIDCDILAVPHHAGIIWPGHWNEVKRQAELRWLYTEGVRPRFAVVSVGTSNTDGHPREEVVKVLRDLGATVLCTQITGRCSDALESLRPGVLPLSLPGRSSPTTVRTGSGNSRDLACAGTVAVDLTPVAMAIRRLGPHQSAVDGLAGTTMGPPLCRR